ncbi:hypothetical protein [Micromonospora sp. CPCC 206061]|uniref:hypothetical protein n=1 Tax=Micromonospora sp. CPCC 206061 TaxID=3122410 RepID=UPI002FEF1EB6
MTIPARAVGPDGKPEPGRWRGQGRVDGPGDVARVLAAVNDAGVRRTVTEDLSRLVDRASSSAYRTPDATNALPVVAELAPLLPWGGLRRGATIATAGSGAVLMTLIGGAQRAGGFVAVVGCPWFGAVAAPEYAVDLSRLALVPDPGPQWDHIVAILMDGVDLVVVAPAEDVPAGVASRLAARARQRGCVLMPTSRLDADGTRPPLRWPGADLVLEVTGHRWEGLGQGQGRLRRLEVDVTARGRGSAVAPRRVRVPMPPQSLTDDAGEEYGAALEELLAQRPRSAPAPRAGEVTQAEAPRAAPDPWADLWREGRPSSPRSRGGQAEAG